MDEASRCDRILLIRDGQLLADAEPAELLTRTGASDMEAAFLLLCGDQAVSA
jgi:ABC-2 type transport system ATP-binding protein